MISLPLKVDRVPRNRVHRDFLVQIHLELNPSPSDFFLAAVKLVDSVLRSTVHPRQISPQIFLSASRKLCSVTTTRTMLTVYRWRPWLRKPVLSRRAVAIFSYHSYSPTHAYMHVRARIRRRPRSCLSWLFFDKVVNNTNFTLGHTAMLKGKC